MAELIDVLNGDGAKTGRIATREVNREPLYAEVIKIMEEGHA